MEQNQATSTTQAEVKHILTLDIGGSAIKYGICDLQGNLTNKGQVQTPVGPDSKVEDLIDAIKQIFENSKAKSEFEGMAIAIPGVTSNGFMRTGGFLHYNIGQPLADKIEQAIGMRPVIENDAKAAAEAELWIGALQGVSSGAVLILGTGLGGGLILNGQVYQGPRGSAGELSAFEMLGRKQYHRNFSNAANTVSATGLLIKVCNALGLEMVFDDDKHYRHIPIDGRKVFEMLEQGEPKVQQALDEFGLDTGYLIFNLCVVLDLERVAIGGGISSQPALIEAIKKGVDEAWSSNYISKSQIDLITKPEISVCKFENDANLIGAMHHYLVTHKLV